MECVPCSWTIPFSILSGIFVTQCFVGSISVILIAPTVWMYLSCLRNHFREVLNDILEVIIPSGKVHGEGSDTTTYVYNHAT